MPTWTPRVPIPSSCPTGTCAVGCAIGSSPQTTPFSSSRQPYSAPPAHRRYAPPTGRSARTSRRSDWLLARGGRGRLQRVEQSIGHADVHVYLVRLGVEHDGRGERLQLRLLVGLQGKYGREAADDVGQVLGS